MRTYCDDVALRAGIVLDQEHKDVDLRVGFLGALILDALVGGMVTAHARYQDPEGEPWEELRPATIARKGHRTIGIATGETRITDPRTWELMPRRIQERTAYLWVPPQDPRFGQIQGWQLGNERNNCPARRLLGWSKAAEAAARALVAAADFAARD